MGTAKLPVPLLDGKPLNVGGKEIELDCSIPKGQFLSGACFGQGVSAESSSSFSKISAQPTKKFKLPSIAGCSTLALTSTANSSSGQEKQLLAVSIDGGPADITNLQSHWSANWLVNVYFIQHCLIIVGGDVKIGRTKLGTAIRTSL